MPYAGGMSWDQDGRRIQDPWTPEGEEELAFSWEIEDGLLVQANSLEELANVMGLAPEAIETFLATVKRYNELVDAGDTDFGKRPELMAKIEQPPFYGLRMNVELGVSVSGLITNADSECLTEAGAGHPRAVCRGQQRRRPVRHRLQRSDHPGHLAGPLRHLRLAARAALGEIACFGLDRQFRIKATTALTRASLRQPRQAAPIDNRIRRSNHCT